MAKIYILHSREENEVVRSLREELIKDGHDVVLSNFELGQDIEFSKESFIEKADIYCSNH